MNEHQEHVVLSHDPVAVHINSSSVPLTTEERPTREWTVGQITMNAGDPPVRIIGRNPNRRRLVLRTSTSPGAVWVGPIPQMAGPTEGFPVPNFAGESLELHTTYEVWASTNVNGAVVSFLAEHRDG